MTTDRSGNLNFSVIVGMQATTGQYISATATDPNGNTSAFAQDVSATPSVAPVTSAALAPLVSASSSPATTDPAPVAIGVLTDLALDELAGSLPHARRRSRGA